MATRDSRNTGDSSTCSSRLRFVNKKCYCGVRAAIRCSESEAHKNWLYYNCQDKLCKFFEWAQPIGFNEDQFKPVTLTNNDSVNDAKQMLLELSSMRADIVVLKESVQKSNVVNKTIYVLGLANVALCLCVCFLLCINLIFVISK